MSDTKERIGNVTLDYTYYSGQDFYSEGPAEEHLLNLVKQYPESEYDKVIESCRTWNVLYHLSKTRENIIRWLPLTQDMKVLEIGSGCGAITGELARNSGHVDCVELSQKRSMINAYRHKEYDNINILVGNFQDIEPHLDTDYDYIMLIGVFEYSCSYIQSDNPYIKMLDILKQHIKKDGKIVIAIENRLGLKYFAGCKEDHTGEYFGGLMGYSKEDGVRTFSRRELVSMLNEAQLYSKFYYPYPDYKLPHTIYSDEMMPRVGDLTTNIRNFDADRIVLFDESKAFDEMIRDELFGVFSNSFLVVATLNEEAIKEQADMPIFAKFSNERLSEYRLYTVISQNQEGEKEVYKRAISVKANPHIQRISDNAIRLAEQYLGTGMMPVPCTFEEGKEPTPLLAGFPSKAKNRVRFTFIKGYTLENLLDTLMNNEEYERVSGIFREYARKMMSMGGVTEFRTSSAFESVFGKHEFKKTYHAAHISNFDMIFSNIIVNTVLMESGMWTVLDYEWVFDFPVPIEYIIYRAFYYYFATRSDCGYFKYLEQKGITIADVVGFELTEEARLQFREMEHAFQLFIIGGVASLEVMQAVMPVETFYLDALLSRGAYLRNLHNPKIYFRDARGFLPENQISITARVDDGKVHLNVPVERYFQSLRVDPTEYPCIIRVSNIMLVDTNGIETVVNSIITNGMQITGRSILFNTDDAQIILSSLPANIKRAEFSYTVSMLDQSIFDEVTKKYEQIYEKRDKLEHTLIYRALRKLRIVPGKGLASGFRIVKLTDE